MRAPIRRYTDDNNTLRVESFYHIIAEPGKEPWSSSLHSHDDLLEISLIVAGKAFFECSRVRYTLVPGDLVVKNAGVLHSEILGADQAGYRKRAVSHQHDGNECC